MTGPRQLRDEPDEAWLVYSDALLERGDVRGELIRLQLSQVRSPDQRAQRAERALLATEVRLSGPKNVLAALNATWRRGFLSVVKAPRLQDLRVLLSHESGALLDEIVLDNAHSPLDELVHLIGSSQHAGLRALTIRADDTHVRYEGTISLRRVLLLPELRRLSALVYSLHVGDGEGCSSSVHTLELSARELPLAALDSWFFPSLRTLALSRHAGVPRVRSWGRVELTENPWPPLVLHSRWSAGRVMPQLEEFSVGGYIIDSGAVEQLTDLVARHPRLAKLDLRDCAVPDASRAMLARLRCEVLFAHSVER